MLVTVTLEICVLYPYYPFYVELPWDVVKRNLGYHNLLESVLYFAISSAIVFVLYSIIILIYTFQEMLGNKKKINWWFWGTVLLMLFFFYFGIFVLDDQIGLQPIKLVLRNIDGSIYDVKGIECNNNFVIGENVSCKVLPKLKNVTTKITFFFENGTKEGINDLNFVAPDNLKSICFNVDGIDASNIKRELSVCTNYRFLSKEEYIERRKMFLSYLVGLFGVIFVTIPTAIVNIKKLWKRK